MASLMPQLDRERVVASYYRYFYWWAGHMGVSTYNLGYSPISDEATARTSSTEHFQFELYRQVAFALNPVRLLGRRVLEISCGLGGGFAHLAQHFGIESSVVLDRSINAVRWARRRFGLNAINADARMLPLADSSFDAIITVEASHEYFSDRFISEIARVLVPNGLLGLADLRYAPSDLIEAAMRYDLARHGLHLIEFIDVTRNVVEACELDAPRRNSLLAKVPWPARDLIRPWIGLNNSENFQQLRDRRATYFILVAERRNDTSHISTSGTLDTKLVILAGDRRLRIAKLGHRGRHYAVYGPYVGLSKGLYRSELQLTNASCKGATMDVCCDIGKTVLAAQPCTAKEMATGLIHCDFSVPSKGVTDLEVRLSVPGGFLGTVEKLSIMSLKP